MTKIALFQSQTGIDPEANATALVAAVETAALEGAGMLFTPEMSGLLDRNSARAMPNRFLEEDDPVLAAVRGAAVRHKMWVHLGSLAVRTGDSMLANRAFVIDASGNIRGRYDKLHLFDVDLPTGESWRESAVYARGEQTVMVTGTPVGNLGLSICYDLRFPALYARLAEAGADVIAIPAAFTVPTGRAHWHVMMRARAIEAGLFVVAAAQSGHHEDGRDTYGHSLVVDPWGDVLLDAGEAVGVHFAEINLKRIEEVRRSLPALHHRRPIPDIA
ncbi:MAG TPA: carbon-nitrogen hydrolase family protein [Sphingomicrobium sp.]|nr:carbon-nitrogen hydrolase family protein [Sphingomicrobium sp.]